MRRYTNKALFSTWTLIKLPVKLYLACVNFQFAYIDLASMYPGVACYSLIFQKNVSERKVIALRSTMLREVQSLVILLVVSCTYAVSYAANDEPCPTWFHRSQEGQCECGQSLQGIVSCDNATQRVGVLNGYQRTIRAFKQLKGLNLQAFRSKHQCESVSIEPLEADDSTPLIKNWTNWVFDYHINCM